MPKERDWRFVSTVKEFKSEDIPNLAGVYRIVCENPNKLKFTASECLDDVNKKRYDKNHLKEKNRHHNDKILYIGKADANNGLRNRLVQYVNKRGHKGGRAIWQIKQCENLKIEYFKCDDCEKVEKALINNFAAAQRQKEPSNRPKSFYYPLTNWRL